MNANERLQLDKLIREHNVQDNTERIRLLRHSARIRADLGQMLRILHDHKGNDDLIFEKAVSECSFLYENYTSIFNKLRKREIQLTTFMQFIKVLEDIEEGRINQHEGSYRVGQLLKELYVDSALQRAEKLDALHGKEAPKTPTHTISYAAFKQQQQQQPQDPN